MKMSRLCLAIVAVVALAACGPANQASLAVQSLNVTAKEFAFTPAAFEVTAGQPVKLTFRNDGSVEHDFSIREIELVGSATASGDAQSANGHMMGGMTGQPQLHVAAGAGATATLEFTPGKAGTYEYYCTVAGHKESGMAGVLTVKAP